MKSSCLNNIFFRLEKGQAYQLHIPVIDNDDDHIICTLSEFIEARELGPFLYKLHHTGVLSVDKVRNLEDMFFVVENSTKKDSYFSTSKNL